MRFVWVSPFCARYSMIRRAMSDSRPATHVGVVVVRLTRTPNVA